MISGSGSIAARMTNASSRISAAYMRVSTEDQNLDLQESLLKAQKPDRIYSDKDTGTNAARTAYRKLCQAIEMDEVRELWVYRLDRLGRDPRELIRFFDILEVHQVIFKSITEPWLTKWNEGPWEFRIWWDQLGAARFELLLLKDRQKRGIATQQDLIRRGLRTRPMGRPRKSGPDKK
ncbi:MAG TPA: recombinase family protein [Candidatus Wunengus sp. YC60]|uniref:recombinase family protein n=1 Tax=Candidatus Wunengus sp. YC60 TaxID=3367697 RepID=UPI0040291859